MSYKTELIAMAVRIAAEHTNLIRKPEPFEALITEIFGGESYDRRIAKDLEGDAQRLADAAKRFRTNRKFKKIVEHV